MSCQLTLQGQVVVGGGGCCGGDGGSQKIQGLSFGCPYTLFQAIFSTDCAVPIVTSGAVGDAWVELPGTGVVGGYLLLIVKSTGAVRLRIGAAPAELLGAAGTFPTGFAGGETFAFIVDSVAVAVVFTSGAQSVLQVATQINQAALGAGLDFLPAFAQTNGQLGLRGEKTGKQGSLDITTARAAIGFPSAAAESEGEGEDQDVSGLLLQQFPNNDMPTRIQISGNAQVEVLAAGTAAA